MNHKTNRFKQLDGLRGLASLSVFFSHIVGMVTLTGTFFHIVNFSPIHILWDGAAAVMMFFVLSGFVLTLPFVENGIRLSDVIPFIIKRFFRIYPAYLFAIIFSLTLKTFLYSPDGLHGLSNWALTGLWIGTTTSWTTVLKHIIMIGPSFDTHQLNPVFWTLIIEMRVSLIFPILLYLLKFVNSYYRGVLLILLFSVLGIISQKMFFVPLFILGGIIAVFSAKFLRYLSILSRTKKISIGFIAIILYTARFSLPGVGQFEFLVDYLIGLGSVLIILLSLSSTKFSWLMSSKPVAILGKISYSFYLLHLPILISLQSLLFSQGYALLLIWLLSFITTVLVAYFCYTFIEIPFQRYGRTLANSLLAQTAQSLQVGNLGSSDFLSPFSRVTSHNCKTKDE